LRRFEESWDTPSKSQSQSQSTIHGFNPHNLIDRSKQKGGKRKAAAALTRKNRTKAQETKWGNVQECELYRARNSMSLVTMRMSSSAHSFIIMTPLLLENYVPILWAFSNIQTSALTSPHVLRSRVCEVLRKDMPYSSDNHNLSMEWRCREELVWPRRSLCLTEERFSFSTAIQPWVFKQWWGGGKDYGYNYTYYYGCRKVKLHSKHVKHPSASPSVIINTVFPQVQDRHRQYCLPSARTYSRT